MNHAGGTLSRKPVLLTGRRNRAKGVLPEVAPNNVSIPPVVIEQTQDSHPCEKNGAKFNPYAAWPRVADTFINE